MSLAPLERPVLRWGIPRQGVRALALQCSSAIRARHAAFPVGRAGSRTRLRPHRGRLLRSAAPGCTVDCEDLTRPSTGALWMQGLAYLVPCRSGGGRPHPFAVPAIESQTGGPAPRSTNVVVEGAGPGHPRPFCTVRGGGASGGAESTEAPLCGPSVAAYCTFVAHPRENFCLVSTHCTCCSPSVGAYLAPLRTPAINHGR